MSDLKDALKRVIVPMNPDGYFIIVVSCVITLLLLLLSNVLGFIGIILTAFVIYFFRDPERVPPDDSEVVLVAADGIVDKIEETLPPKELELETTETFNRVSIFLNTFNVHVQRVPMTGTIEKTEYIQGKFLNITNDKYHEENERQLCLMKTTQGFHIIFVQIAGLVARRIVFKLKEGQKVAAGERFGSIKFGSRVDIYLPKKVELCVKEGQTMIGGETVIGIVR